MVVQHNLRAMNSNRMLGLTASAQSKSTEKLSSGYKINRAADDAAGLSISEKMRKQIRGLSQASLNASDGISAVQTAEGALNEVQDMLQRMNELAVKASNGTMSEDDRNYIQDEIEQLVTEIDRVAETTKFNETYLLKGDADSTDVKFSYKEAKLVDRELVYFDENGDLKTVAKDTYASVLDDSITYYDAEKTVAKKVGVQATATIGSHTAISTFNGNTDTNLFKKDATTNDYVKVEVGAELDTATTSYFHVTFNGDKVATATVVAAPTSVVYCKVTQPNTVWDENGNELKQNDVFKESDYAKYYTDVSFGKFDPDDKVTIASVVGKKEKAQFVDKDGNEIAENGLYRYLEVDKDGELKLTGELFYNDEKRTAVDAADIGEYINVDTFDRGALSLKLHVGADATDDNQIQIDIQAMSSERLGISNVDVSGATDEGALNAIETIKEAIQMISTQRSALGAVQNRLEHTIANLDNVVENTTAAESQIRDTDMATEMVKYSNNNILAQAGQAMLAQANQANQGVLSILG